VAGRECVGDVGDDTLAVDRHQVREGLVISNIYFRK
jgi:hypothetical protein